MRTKKLSKKLSLKKQTVSNLSVQDLSQINGGGPTDPSPTDINELSGFAIYCPTKKENYCSVFCLTK